MIRTTAIALLLLLGATARAELVIEITRGADDALPVAIVPFAGPVPGANAGIADIVRDDLERSGRFKPLPYDKLPVRPASVKPVTSGASSPGIATSPCPSASARRLSRPSS